MASVYEKLEATGAGAVIVLGLILVFFPEPSTSAIGALMVLIGVGMWASKWRKRQTERGIEREERVAASPTQD